MSRWHIADEHNHALCGQPLTDRVLPIAEFLGRPEDEQCYACAKAIRRPADPHTAPTKSGGSSRNSS